MPELGASKAVAQSYSNEGRPELPKESKGAGSEAPVWSPRATQQ